MIMKQTSKNISKSSFGLTLALFLSMAVIHDAGAVEGLAQGLTPIGAEQSGNSAGTIPAWTGGLTAPPEGYVKGKAHIDPFASDAPIASITSKNFRKYAENLTEFDKAMFERHAETYKLNVYPTRRSCAFPQFVYDALARNAKTASLTNDGNGIAGATISSPFPIPKSGIEVYWNHNLHYKGFRVTQKVTGGVVTSDGTFVRVVRDDRMLGYYYDPELQSVENINNDVEMEWLAVWSAPPRMSGSGFSMSNTIDQVKKPRNGYMFRPDNRKVMAAPANSVSYDAPIMSGFGTRNSDDMFIGNGAPDRYNWKLLGKKEIYIPYNSYKTSAESTTLEDIIKPGHLNPDYLRYELHRVWVVEATLKKEQFNHTYHRRITYYDEDSWIAVGADLYDENDALVAGQVGFIKNYYEVPACRQDFDAIYQFSTDRYNLDNMKIEFGPTNYDADIRERDFGASSLRRAIAR